MLSLFSILADGGITIHIGNNVWSFNSNMFIYLLVAAVVGVVAEFLVGWRLPFGIIGAIIAGVIGIWLMTQVIVITGLPDWEANHVQLIPAVIGAIILVAIWHAVTYPTWRSRRSYYRG